MYIYIYGGWFLLSDDRDKRGFMWTDFLDHLLILLFNFGIFIIICAVTLNCSFDVLHSNRGIPFSQFEDFVLYFKNLALEFLWLAFDFVCFLFWLYKMSRLSHGFRSWN